MQAGHSPIVAYIICFLQHLHIRMDAEECDRDTIPVAPIRILQRCNERGEFIKRLEKLAALSPLGPQKYSLRQER